MALELGLTHPFAAAHAFRNGHLDAIAGSDFIFGITYLAPASVCIPKLGIDSGRFPKVGFTVQVIISGIQRLYCGLRFRSNSVLGTIDELPGYAVEVGYHEELIGCEFLDVQAVHFGENGGLGDVAIEYTCRKFNVVAGSVGAKSIGRNNFLCGSVIVCGTVAGIVSVGTPAGLPVAVYHTVCTRVEHVLAVGKEGELVIGNTIRILIMRICTPPSSGIAEVGTAAHVTGSLVVRDPCLAFKAEERICGAGIGALRNKLVVPCNTVGVVRSIDECHQLEFLLHVCGLGLNNQEARILNKALVRNVRYDGTGVEYKVNLFDTVFSPAILKSELGSLRLCREEVVFVCSLGLGAVFGTLVGICLTVGWSECIVTLIVEGEYIVIEEAALAVGFAGPPALRIGHGLAATEMSVLGAVPYPVLTGASGECADVRSGIERVTIGIVEGEGLHYRTNGCAAGIVCLHFHGVFSGFAETELKAVSGVGVLLVLLAVDEYVGTEYPDGGHALIEEIEGDIVCLLVYVNLDLEIRGLGKLALAYLRILGHAGCSKEACCCNCYILPNLFHCT